VGKVIAAEIKVVVTKEEVIKGATKVVKAKTSEDI
jgi:hypothetical protein